MNRTQHMRWMTTWQRWKLCQLCFLEHIKKNSTMIEILWNLGDKCDNSSKQSKIFRTQFKRDQQTHVGIWCPIGWHVSSQARMSWWYAWPWVEAQKWVEFYTGNSTPIAPRCTFRNFQLSYGWWYMVAAADAMMLFARCKITCPTSSLRDSSFVVCRTWYSASPRSKRASSSWKAAYGCMVVTCH